MADAATITPNDGTAEAFLRVRDRWDGGAVIDVELTARAPTSAWTIVVEVDGRITNLWNATILERDGDRIVLGPASYNALIPAGGTVDVGFQVEGAANVSLIALETVLAADAASESVADAPDAPPLPPLPEQAEAPEPDATVAQTRPPPAAPEPEDAAPPPSPTPAPSPAPPQVDGPLGGLEVLGPRVLEAGAPPPFAALPALTAPLSTRGSDVVDAGGTPVSLYGLSWFGLETDIFTPHGLWARNWRELMDEVRELGFNTLRIPFSGELVRTGGAVDGVDFALNPDLEGLDGLQILDQVVAYAQTIGLGLILDYHRGAAGSGPNDNGLWYGNGRTEADVAAEWRAVAERYGEAASVVGIDLINEPFLATWGDGSRTDWAAAAERLGNGVHETAPHWLILVQGVAVHEGTPYWWGGNLSGARERPITFNVPDKLVYSPHDYPASVHAQPWFFDGTDLEQLFFDNWGFLAEEEIAPVVVGEWGSFLTDPLDLVWADAIARYMADAGISWLWWSLNPNSGDTGGLYADDWRTVRPEVMAVLEPFLEAPAVAANVAEASAQFTLERTGPTDEALTLTYATVDGSARAGLDYKATAGTLSLEPGVSRATIDITIFDDIHREGAEDFFLVLSGPGDVRASVRAEIVDPDDRRALAPFQNGTRDAELRADASAVTLLASERAPSPTLPDAPPPTGERAADEPVALFSVGSVGTATLPAREAERSATAETDAAIAAAKAHLHEGGHTAGGAAAKSDPSRFAFASSENGGVHAPLDEAEAPSCAPVEADTAAAPALAIALPDLQDLEAFCG